MFYGNALLKQQNNIIENSTTDSIIYNEYLNRCNMLESCTDEQDGIILEAQAEVLYELSIKEVWRKIKVWVIKRLLAIVNGLEKLFSKGKQTKFKTGILNLLNKAKKGLEEAKQANSKEEVDKCKETTDSISNEFNSMVNNIANGDDKDLAATAADMAKKADEAEDKGEGDKLKEDLKNKEEQHEKRKWWEIGFKKKNK
jgi:hypothetical protein